MYNDDKLSENWGKFIATLNESPRADWGDWSDAAEKAGPYDDQGPDLYNDPILRTAAFEIMSKGLNSVPDDADRGAAMASLDEYKEEVNAAFYAVCEMVINQFMRQYYS